MVSVVNASGNQDIDGILWGWKYDITNITFSFPTSSAEYGGYAQVNGFQSFNSKQENAVRDSLNLIASYVNITFTETTGVGAQFRFADATSIDYTDDPTVSSNYGLNTINTAQGNPPSLADGTTPPTTPGYAQGDTWFNPNNYNNPTVGSYQGTAGIMHEIGHDMGLKHGHVTQVGHGVTFPTLPADHDSYEYSVMTYKQFPDDNPSDGDSAPDHPTSYMQDDIAAMQYMYGANYNTNNGNTTYTWDPTTGAESINGVVQTNLNGETAPADGEIFQTVWDGGGNDTYDFSNFTTNMSIDLIPGDWTVLDTSAAHRQRADLGYDTVTSSEYYARGNIANALQDPNNPNETASLIENATGGSGDDQIYGNVANNTLKGGGGNDLIEGGDGNDTLWGGNGFTSNTGDDTLKGGGGDDYLYGEDGNDTLKGGGGADYLNGGAGFDTADYSQSSAGVYVNLTTGLGFGGDAQGDTLVSIESVVGTPYADTLVGNAAGDVLSGGDGDDYIYSGGTNNTLDGGTGTNLVSFYYLTSGVTVDLSGTVAPGGAAAGDALSNFQNLEGTNFADTLYGSTGANIIYGDGGDDTINAGAGADTVYGGDGDDLIVDNDNIDFDYYDGGAGNNTIDYSADTFGNGFVTINLLTGVATVNLASGNTETIVNFQNVNGSQGGDIIIGSNSAGVLNGEGGNDTITGGAGNDTLIGGTGADSLNGGGGINTADYSTSSAGVTVNLLNGTGVGGDAQGDTLTNIQSLTGSAFSDFLTGTTAGAGTLLGGAGNDTLVGESAGSHLDGGTGSDYADFYDSTAGVTVNLTTGVGSGGYAQGDSVLNFENAEGSNFNDTLYGTSGQNLLYGLGGNDVLFGLNGNDLLYGGDGDDTLIGGAGADFMDGGTGVNTASYAGTPAAVKVNLTTGVGAGSYASGDTLVNIQNLIGGSFDDILTGNSGANVINGGAGADTMTGLGGNDTYYVDNAGDVVNEAVGGGTDRVYTTVNYALGVGQEIEYLATTSTVGTGAINLTGNSFAQTITGNAGANVINGGGGADTMVGLGGNDTYYVDNPGDVVREAVGGGTDRVLTSVNYTLTAGQEIEIFSTTSNAGTGAINLTGNSFGQTITGNAGKNVIDGGGGLDTLTGNGGADTFVFDTALASTNLDRVTDFTVGTDLIDLSHSIFTTLATGTLAAADFFIGSAAQNANEHILYNSTNGWLSYDPDGNGASGAKHFATLSTSLALTNTSFKVI